MVHAQLVLDHIEDSIFDNWLASVWVNHLDHHGVWAQNVEHVVSPGVLFLGVGGKIINLLLGNCDGIVNLKAIEVDVLLNIVELIGLVEYLPCDVPVDLLSRLFVLLLAHWLSTSIHIPARVVKLGVQVLIHLVSLLLVSLHDAGISVFQERGLVHILESARSVLHHHIQCVSPVVLRQAHALVDHLLGPESLRLLG